jgi:hypothetical protein
MSLDPNGRRLGYRWRAPLSSIGDPPAIEITLRQTPGLDPRHLAFELQRALHQLTTALLELPEEDAHEQE